MEWKYPLSDIDLEKDEEMAVRRVLQSKWISMGPVTEQFENDFSNYMKVSNSVAVSSCTAALHLAMKILDVKEGDEVILPATTFVATANAVLYVGAKPVFADVIGIDNLNISPSEIESKITKNTKAIMIMHYGGYPCDMDAIVKMAEDRHIPLVEDAAHAVGAEYRGKKCGTFGDVGCFSFFANKNMTTGEGGMMIVKNARLAERARRLRSHGMETISWDKFKGHVSTYNVKSLGYNYRITEIQSALGIVQLKKLDENNKKREDIDKLYVDALGKSSKIILPMRGIKEVRPSFHLCPILVEPEARNVLIEKLKRQGIQASVHYPPIHLMGLYTEAFGKKTADLPVTEEAGLREVSLPLHQLMKGEDVTYITRRIKEILWSMKSW